MNAKLDAEETKAVKCEDFIGEFSKQEILDALKELAYLQPHICKKLYDKKCEKLYDERKRAEENMKKCKTAMQRCEACETCNFIDTELDWWTFEFRKLEMTIE